MILLRRIARFRGRFLSLPFREQVAWITAYAGWVTVIALVVNAHA